SGSTRATKRHRARHLVSPDVEPSSAGRQVRALRTLSWWRIRVRSAEFNRRILLQAFRELRDDLRDRRDDPRVVPGESVGLLLQIGEEVDDLRQWEGQRRVIHVLLPDEVYLPVPPFDGRQPISDVGRKSFAVRVLVFAKEELQLIDTVNRTILRNL